jgi:shikimate dehydrogenase
MKQYGLIGKSLSHSFSKTYFEQKFIKEGIIDTNYSLFELSEIADFKDLIDKKSFCGLNVTIPYKEAIIPFLDQLDEEAKAIGAVNTIQFTASGLKGFNTDLIGFRNSIKPFLENIHTRALILGTGGASMAVAYALEQLGIKILYVSRTPKNENQISYADVNQFVMKHHLLIINTSPIGTHPNINDAPKIPYEYLTEQHFLYDLVYNPAETAFLKKAIAAGAIAVNGEQMLKIQAEEAWKIWTSIP